MSNRNRSERHWHTAESEALLNQRNRRTIERIKEREAKFKRMIDSLGPEDGTDYMYFMEAHEHLDQGIRHLLEAFWIMEEEGRVKRPTSSNDAIRKMNYCLETLSLENRITSGGNGDSLFKSGWRETYRHEKYNMNGKGKNQ